MLRDEHPSLLAGAQDGAHPRPQLIRASWTELAGEWDFRFDDDDLGRAQHWESPEAWAGAPSAAHDGAARSAVRAITVPFPFESPASGIGDTGFHPVVWYRRAVARAELPQGERVLLHFGAVDHRCHVWVDGRLAGSHEGGSTPFTLDITELTGEGGAEIVVRAEDDPFDVSQPRGKQDWRRSPHSIWYHRTTGIWQPVWLEGVAPRHITGLHWSADIHTGVVTAELRFSRRLPEGCRVRIELSVGDEELASVESAVSGTRAEVLLPLARQQNGQAYEELLWSPERPTLVDAVVVLEAPGSAPDVVGSYLGLRSVAVDGGRFLLNDRPRYLRSVLNQGYWPESHSAAPSAEALRREAELILELGFNATRLHQKYEDPRFLFWADRLGLLVWAEAPAAYAFDADAVERTVAEWTAVVDRDRSHPSIVAWVPLNESWGVQHIAHDPRMVSYAKSLVHLTKSLDPTRPVISNDGWEHVESDILSIHDYDADPEAIRERYRDRRAVLDAPFTYPGRRLVVDGSQRLDVPIMLTEFGGISYLERADDEAWGYSSASSAEEFADRLDALLEAVRSSPALAGFCYTQLADTGQETNGLVFEDRRPKVPAERIRRAIRGY
ncbi:glycoside hydrolase family 2 protein [Leifsonia sp. AG29]|uniref:glycoside hydrolase family 2 protein n=1 Tax=Leifsonia sp. AG29 TaxID=2598860 RepID=UPI00131E81AE|nr:glycoside hydrolase family 2 TIM barrel-domain containing protein [Leifsonia sp. AG29]